MKRIVIVFLIITAIIFLLSLPLFSANQKENIYEVMPALKGSGIIKGTIETSAEKAILIDMNTGIVLYSKNSDDKCGMASTTKIMTCILAIENMSLYDTVTITKDAVGIEGSSIYLKEGEIFTVYDLLMGLMLESGNDAAVAIAIECSGSVARFTELMNLKAEELGMENTNFTNPHGLSNEMHFSTARDMATLSRYAMQNQVFQDIVKTEKYSIKPKNDDYIRYCRNHNKMLFNYEGTTGIKTGYTKADGRCLITSFEKEGKELICVTLNAPDHWNDHKVLYENSLNTLKKRTLAKRGEYAFEISVVGGKENYVTVANLEDIEIYIPDEAITEIKVVLPPFVYAEINKNDILGELRIYCNDEIIYNSPLCSIESISRKKVSFFKRIFG